MRLLNADGYLRPARIMLIQQVQSLALNPPKVLLGRIRGFEVDCDWRFRSSNQRTIEDCETQGRGIRLRNKPELQVDTLIVNGYGAAEGIGAT